LAYLGGTDNTFTATSKVKISSASAGANAGCLMLAGTKTNTAKIIGDAINIPAISGTSAISTTALVPPSGGLFYLKGITQIVELTNVQITSSTASGNGGVIYSEVVTIPPTGVTPSVTITITGPASSSQFFYTVSFG
jgi:predicted outer membrane repeat protein